MKYDLKTAMVRSRAYENNIFFAFTHAEKSMITGPEGEVTIIDKAEWIEDKMREWREFFAEDAEAAPAERKGRGFTDLWE